MRGLAIHNVSIAPVLLGVQMSHVECNACGYEAEGLTPPVRCPKCLGFRTFHRVPVPGSLFKAITGEKFTFFPKSAPPM